jgi:hypothetical protein
MTSSLSDASIACVPGARAVPDDDALFLAFVGRNQPIYLRTLEKMRAKDPHLRKLAPTLCWPAFFVTVPWLLYRKLYGWAAVMIGLPVVMGVVAPSLSGLASPLGIFLVIWGRPFYVRHAFNRIRKLRERAKDEDELKRLVEKAGGVSVFGAVIGVFITVGLVALSAQAQLRM